MLVGMLECANVLVCMCTCVRAFTAHLAVLHRELVQQHAHVVRLPLPVLVAEVLQQADGLVEPVEDTHHPGGCEGRERDKEREAEEGGQKQDKI